MKNIFLKVTSQSNFHLSPKTGSYSQTTNYARIKSETFRKLTRISGNEFKPSAH